MKHETDCCCNCKYLVPDYSHPCTDGKRVTEQRGWICIGLLDEGMAHSDWLEHGLCELHDRRETAAALLDTSGELC